MLTLQPLHYDKIWGYEDWLASTHPDGCQPELLAAVGADFPLLVKIIQADETLSVQVHPDDEAALLLEGVGSRGKTECWYVLDAAPDAQLVYGLHDDYPRETLATAIAAGRLESCLRFVHVQRDDFIYIPAGTIHAIGGGLRLLEVQQSCNTTYRLYDWNRGRELHVEKSLRVIRHEPLLPIAPFGTDFTSPYFSLHKRTLANGAAITAGDWTLLFTLQADSGACLADGKTSAELRPESLCALAPGETAIMHDGSATLLEIRATN